MFPERGVRVSLSFWLALCLGALICPPVIFTSVLLAAAMHEAGHLLMLFRFRVPPDGLRLRAFGAEIYAPGLARLSYGRELLVTLAGPAVNLLCAPLFAAVALRRMWPAGLVFAGAHALLGCYNLLPIPPLDGSRALRLAVSWLFGPEAGDRTADAAGLAAAAALLAFGAALTLRRGAGVFFLLAAASLFIGSLPDGQAWPCRVLAGRAGLASRAGLAGRAGLLFTSETDHGKRS